MDLPVKLLKQQDKPFVPVTIAEAVMVNHSTGVIRLDEALNLKLEGVITPVGSGLTSEQTNNVVVISHSNIINPNDSPKPILVQHDNRGHIIDTKPVEKIKVVIGESLHISYDGSEEKTLEFGDDFNINEQGQVKIIWNNINQ